MGATTHIWPGCWKNGGDWVHAWSDDLVHWTLGGFANLGDSGAVGVDETGAVFAVTSGLTVTPSASLDLEAWGNATTLFKSDWRHGPGDPPRPWRAADGTWRAATCGVNCVGSATRYPCPAGALVDLWASATATFQGANASWARAPAPLWVSNETLFPALPGDREPVTIDVVTHLPGDASGEVLVLLNNQYGPMCASRGRAWTAVRGRHVVDSHAPLQAVPHPPSHAHPPPRTPLLQGTTTRCAQREVRNTLARHDSVTPPPPLQEYLLGTQPNGYALVPTHRGALDWGSIVVNASGLFPAWVPGGTQFSMARTAVGESGTGRRTLHAWFQNGDSGGSGSRWGADNTVALPRDVSLSPSGDLLQEFSPELAAALRPSATQHAALPAMRLALSSATPFAVLALPNVSSPAAEVVATFTASNVGGGGGISFGILFHVDSDAPFDPASTRRTAVSVAADCAGSRGTRATAGGGRAGLLTLNRMLTGAEEDADIRGGPAALDGCAPPRGALSATLRCYFDGPLAECILTSGGESAAISGHAHSLASGLAVFAAGDPAVTGVVEVAVAVEAWGGLHL